MRHDLIKQLSEFDWDEGNFYKSLRKHDVEASEAEEIFFNDPLIVLEDAKHSKHEPRFHALGKTNENRKLFASFTVRNHKIRIVSIRPMSRAERGIYEQEKNT